MPNQISKIKKLDIEDLNKEKIFSSDLIIHSNNEGLNEIYAPFEHINKKAKIVIVGITPGWTQLKESYKYVIKNKNLSDDILKIRAKRYASFSGSMRNRLIKWMDQIGLAKALNLETCITLFNDLDDKTIHTNSVLRYPIFYKNKNYSGHNPSLLNYPYFLKQIENTFLPEIEEFSNSLIIPLGRAVQNVLDQIEKEKKKNFKYILSGFPHPSYLNVGSEAIFEKRKKEFLKLIKLWQINFI